MVVFLRCVKHTLIEGHFLFYVSYVLGIFVQGYDYSAQRRIIYMCFM